MSVSTYQTISADDVLAGRYQIEKRLGSGNMGEVYQALDLAEGRQVAIKRIHPHLVADVDAVQRFQREAKALSRLNHPGIVKFHDFYVEDGAYFIIINYLDGQTLEAKLEEAKSKRKLISLEETKGIVLQLCDALAYAHRRGIVHRDLKPANVMITQQGHAVVMDFGIAKLLDGDQLTGDGLSPGTPGYMSPEMIRGRAIDGRADIYTVGIILYEMVTGRRPFQRNSRYDTMHSHLFDVAPDVRKFNAKVPHELAVVITQALAKNPEARFQTAETLGDALRDVEIVSTGEQVWHNGSSQAVPPAPEAPALSPLAFAPEPNQEALITPPPPQPEASAALVTTEPSLPVPPVSADQPVTRPLARPRFSLIGTGFAVLLLCLFITAGIIWGTDHWGNNAQAGEGELTVTSTNPSLMQTGEALPLLEPASGNGETTSSQGTGTDTGLTPTLAPTPTASVTRPRTTTAAATQTPTAPGVPGSQATATRTPTATATSTPTLRATATNTRPPARTSTPTISATWTAQPLPTNTPKTDSSPPATMQPSFTPTPWIDIDPTPTKKKDAEER